jgi:hypothetical protein
MNLKEILHHRDQCLVCQSPMEYHCVDYPNLEYHVSDTCFSIKSGNTSRGIKMKFHFDGKYERGNQNYKIYKQINFRSTPLQIIKACKNCLVEDTSAVKTNLVKDVTGRIGQLKPRSWNQDLFTVINNLKIRGCGYKFQITGGAEGNYDSILNYETTRYHDEKSFWHVDTSFVDGTSELCHGKFSGGLDDILIIKIPHPVNLNNVQNIEQFLNKIKTYIMIS